MSWFDVSGGRLRFGGRVSKHPIADWLASEQGAEAVAAAARHTGFSLFGRTRAARRRLYRDLWAAVSARSLRDSIAAECDRYLAVWGEVAYAPSLPRLTVALQRLVVIPRAMILDRALPRATTRLAPCLDGADVPDPFKAFLSRWILGRMEDAIRRAEPAPQRPLYSQTSWACVGRDPELEWIDPMWSGADWRGHVMLFEMPGSRLQRRERRELEAAIEQLKTSLPNMTRQQRENTIRLAMDQMKSVRV